MGLIAIPPERAPSVPPAHMPSKEEKEWQGSKESILPLAYEPVRLKRSWFPAVLIFVVTSLLFLGLAPVAPRNHLLDALHSPSRSGVPPLDPKFVKACKDLLDEPASLYTQRLARLQDVLGKTGRRSVWVAEPGPSVEYFLGGFGNGVWKPSERPFLAAVVGGTDAVTGEASSDIILLTPAFEEARARLLHLPDDVSKAVTWVTWAESDSPYAALLDHLGGHVQLALDAPVRNFISAGLRAAQLKRGSDPQLDVRLEAAVASLRERKDEREIGLMRCANQFTLHAIRHTRAKMHVGIRESETREILYAEMAKTGLTQNSALILFGENAALPHGSGTDRKLGKSDLVLIDAGGRWGGYLADITRTFPVTDSEISDAHKKVWNIVRDAQRAPADILQRTDEDEPPFFSWLDDRAREEIKKGMASFGVPPQRGGKPDYQVFTHRLGHGIGLEGHEAPYAVQGPLGERPVLSGHSFTLEPGVYIPAGSELGDKSVRGLGVRIEDVVVVRVEEGRLKADWLTGPVEKFGDV